MSCRWEDSQMHLVCDDVVWEQQTHKKKKKKILVIVTKKRRKEYKLYLEGDGHMINIKYIKIHKGNHQHYSAKSEYHNLSFLI